MAAPDAGRQRTGSAAGVVRATHTARAAWLRSVAGLVSTAKCLQAVEAVSSAPEAAGHVLSAMVRLRVNPQTAGSPLTLLSGFGTGRVYWEDGEGLSD